MTDRVRERWAAGEAALNAWVSLGGDGPAAALAEAEFDAVTVDLQHGATPAEDLGRVASAISAAGAVPFARLRWNDPGLAMRALDQGSEG